VKKTPLQRPVRRPMERAWVSSKKTDHQVLPFASSTASDTPPMIASCSVSSGVIARCCPW
jgi:hypothetical protein